MYHCETGGFMNEKKRHYSSMMHWVNNKMTSGSGILSSEIKKSKNVLR